VLNNPEKAIDRWYGKESIHLHDGHINSICYTLAVEGSQISESQKEFFKEVFEKYNKLWPSIAEKIIELEPKFNKLQPFITCLGNNLLFYAPSRVNKETYDFMLGYELKDGESIIASYFFCYRNWQLEFYEVVS